MTPRSDHPIGVEAADPSRAGADVPAKFTGSSGVEVVAFSFGALVIFLDNGRGPRSAMHLSAEQAEQLRGFLRLIDAKDEPRSILDEAREIVHGDREQTHGSPDHNLRAIAGIWSALLRDQLKPGAAVSPQMVCLMMAGLKLARASNRPSHREHALDVVGYMALMERCGWIDPA